MKGFMNIKSTEHGYGIDCDFTDVDPQSKFELMHSVAVALEMDDLEIALYCALEQSGFMRKAESCQPCATEEELEGLLSGSNSLGEVM